MSDTTWTEYSSNSYLVQANKYGVEVTNLHTGDTLWFQGDDASEITAAIEGAARRGGVDSEITERTDYVLSQYFGAR